VSHRRGAVHAAVTVFKWSIWLGEESAESDEVKSVLRTMEGVNWKIAPEAKKTKAGKKPPPPKPEPQPGLF